MAIKTVLASAEPVRGAARPFGAVWAAAARGDAQSGLRWSWGDDSRLCQGETSHTGLGSWPASGLTLKGNGGFKLFPAHQVAVAAALSSVGTPGAGVSRGVVVAPADRVPYPRLCPVPCQINVKSRSSSCVLCLLPRAMSALPFLVGLGAKPTCLAAPPGPSSSQQRHEQQQL